MKELKIIALFGKSCSGKDTIQNWMVSNLPNTKKIISCTTRPPRQGEIDGVDYHFITPDAFGQYVLDGTMLEATSFRNWFYGTMITELDEDKINIGVFNIQGIECLLQETKIEILPVYIDCPDKQRLLRSLNREENPDCEEICRRFYVDAQDFDDIPFEYAIYDNNDNNDNINIHKITQVRCFLEGEDF